MKALELTNHLREFRKKCFPEKNPADYELIEVSKGDRIKAFILKLFGILCFGLISHTIIIVEAKSVGAAEVSVFLVAMGAVVYMFYRSIRTLSRPHEEVLTQEAEERIERERQEKLAVNDDEFYFKSPWYVRYPLALLCAGGVFLIFEHGFSFSEKAGKADWMWWLWVVILSGCILIYAREVSLTALAIGLCYLVFKLMAALPVSAAIIIGAIIIAMALGRR